MDRRCVFLINKLLKCSNAVPHTGSVLLPVCVMSLRGMVTQTDVLSLTENSRATHTEAVLRLQPMPNGSPPGSVLCSVNAHESHQFISNTSADAAGAPSRNRQGVACLCNSVSLLELACGLSALADARHHLSAEVLQTVLPCARASGPSSPRMMWVGHHRRNPGTCSPAKTRVLQHIFAYIFLQHIFACMQKNTAHIRIHARKIHPLSLTWRK